MHCTIALSPPVTQRDGCIDAPGVKLAVIAGRNDARQPKYVIPMVVSQQHRLQVCEFEAKLLELLHAALSCIALMHSTSVYAERAYLQ
jgi:hypothetical protein